MSFQYRHSLPSFCSMKSSHNITIILLIKYFAKKISASFPHSSMNLFDIILQFLQILHHFRHAFCTGRPVLRKQCLLTSLPNSNLCATQFSGYNDLNRIVICLVRSYVCIRKHLFNTCNCCVQFLATTISVTALRIEKNEKRNELLNPS